MKTRFLCAVVFACALPVWAQPDPVIKPINGLPFPLIAPAEAEKSAALQPLVLRMKNVTVAQALDELQLQSGVELDLENVNYSKRTLAKKISIDLETRSFNRAFEQILDAAGLKARLYSNGSERPQRVDFNGNRSQDAAAEAPQSSVGLFAVQLTQLNIRLSTALDVRNIKSPSRTEDNRLTASILLNPDPRLPIIGQAFPRFTRAQDEQGRSLLIADGENRRSVNSYSFYSRNSSQSQTSLTLNTPAPDAKKLSHLDGVVVYSIVTKMEKWEIPDLLSAPQWTRDFQSGDFDMTATIKGAPAKEPGRVSVSIEMTSDKWVDNSEIPPPLLSSRFLMTALKIEDANGNVLRNESTNSSGGAEEGKLKVTLTAYLQSNYAQDKKELALPLKTTFEAPLEVAQTEVPFSFENIPLP